LNNIDDKSIDSMENSHDLVNLIFVYFKSRYGFGITLLFVGIFYMILSSHDFGFLDGITFCAIGIILLVLGYY